VPEWHEYCTDFLVNPIVRRDLRERRMHEFCPSIKLSIGRTGGSLASLLLAGVASLALSGPAHATLTIDPTFDPSLSSSSDAAINSAISAVESNITSPNNITVDIYFNSMTSGLGESLTTIYQPSYFQYYTAFKAVATQPNQITALNSLGAAPTGPSSGNPVNGNTAVQITSAEGRNLGFNTPGGVTVGTATYDSEISLNTGITFPPGPNNGSNYGLQAVANHEIDEALGIGGTGSTLNGTGSLTGPVGDLDLYRYSAPGVRSYTNTNSTSPLAYFSIDGGNTVLSYFSQTTGADFGDWLSNPIPGGFSPQVQDAFGTPGTNPALGPNELTAFNAIGYDLTQQVVPAPLIGHGVPAFLGLGAFLFGVKLWEWSKKTGAVGPAPEDSRALGS
jgi:hypothetical protein